MPAPKKRSASSPKSRARPRSSTPRTARQSKSNQPPDLKHFLPSLLRAAGTKPRDVTTVRGSSGVAHEFLAMGTDDDRGRLVLVSEVGDARSAALAQADVQAALSDLKVIVVRPILVSVGRAIEILASSVGAPVLTGDYIASLPSTVRGDTQEEMDAAWLPLLGPSLEAVGGWVQNARGMEAFRVRPHLIQAVEQLAKIRFRQDGDSFSIDLTGVLSDPDGIDDTQLGICGVPVYEMTSEELETIHVGTDRDAIEGILSAHGVLQFFFPPADSMALGFIDRSAGSQTQIIEMVRESPSVGHPHGSLDLVPTGTALTEMIDALTERGLVIEGEIGHELTPDGEAARAAVRFKAREGLISKLVNRFNVKLDITIFRGS